MTDAAADASAAPLGVQLEAVHTGYGDREVLRDLDLDVPAGELLVVLGPSGAGKSTLLRVVAGLQPLVSGTVRVAGRDVTGWRPGRRNVSMVFQTYALFPHLSVLDNICFGLVVRDTPRAQVVERARSAARTAGCAELLDRRPGELSGGERQRVALARAVAREPDVYLLDEPLSNLDAELRVQTRAELKALHRRTGGTMLHVTHDQAEAMVLGDRIAVLAAGRVAQVGTPDEVWSAPRTVAVARALGTPGINLLPASGPLGPAGLAGADGLLVGIRPDAVRIVGAGAAGAEARVSLVERVGADAYVHLRLGHGDRAGDPVPVVARVPARERPEVEAVVRVAVDAADLHLFDVATGARVER